MDTDAKRYSSEIGDLTSAAERGEAKAQLELGWRYYTGNGVQEDRGKAVKWYRRASEQGLREAEQMLKLLQANSGTVEQEKSAGASKARQGPPKGFESFNPKARKLVLLVLSLIACLLVVWGGYTLGKNAGSAAKTSEAEHHEPASSFTAPQRTAHDPNEGRAVGSIIMHELTKFSQEWLATEPDVNAAGER